MTRETGVQKQAGASAWQQTGRLPVPGLGIGCGELASLPGPAGGAARRGLSLAIR